MSSVDKQVSFSAYEVASLYVYTMLQPTYQDFNWYLRENHVDQNEDHYAYLENCKLHEQYEKTTKDLLQSISTSSFCISQTDIHVQQFPRPFLLDWFKNQGLECPALCLPANQQKSPPQKPVPNIIINTTNNIYKNNTVDRNELEVRQSSNTLQEKNAPSNLSITVSKTLITVKNVNNRSSKKFKKVEMFGAKKKPWELFYAIANQGGVLSLKKYHEIDLGSNDDAHRSILSNLNKTLIKSLSLSKNPFNTVQKEITTNFRKISLVKENSFDALDRENAGEDWLRKNDY